MGARACAAATLAVALTAAAAPAAAAPPRISAADFEARSFASEQAGLTLPYRLFAPRSLEPGQRYPLIVFLHGAGERGSDNERQLVHGALPLAQATIDLGLPAFVVAPQCPEAAQWVDTPWVEGSYSLDVVAISKPLTAVAELLGALEKTLPMDPQRILLTGLSMGGYGAWDLALRFPARFAGLLPICGAGDPSRAASLAALPIWAFHGAADRTVPPAGSWQMIKALRKAGGRPRYTEYPNVGHHSWDRAYANRRALRWLLTQRR